MELRLRYAVSPGQDGKTFAACVFMKKFFYVVMACGFLAACNNEEDNASTADPSTVHPPSEALPDTLQLVNDSVVVVDSNADAGVRARTGNSDSLQRNQ